MKEREVYASLRVLPPVIIRIDGRAFHSFTRDVLDKPFDERFATVMALVGYYFLEQSGLSPRFAYIFSDEISLYFDKLPYDGRIEKLNSVVASYASSVYTLRWTNLGITTPQPIAFDSRVIPMTLENLCPYLLWRQKEAWRNHNNAYAQHVMREAGHSPKDVSRYLHGKDTKALHEVCFSHGINLAHTPAWQRRGILVYKRVIEKSGRDPRTGAEVIAYRKETFIDWDIPLFSTKPGQELIHRILYPTYELSFPPK
jgi:tRNA(His) 5'-end guanylyltransferase